MSGLNDINDIPKAWRNALASVQHTFPDAVLAGGALRDREHGVKVKDLDIFISTTGMRDRYGAGTIVSKLQRDGWASVELNGEESYKDDGGRGIVAVVDVKYPGAPDVNIIALKNFKLEEFDFGICQIMFDGKTIVRSRDYHLDAAARQFRLIPQVTDKLFGRSLDRWFRLREKYPDWSLHLGSRAVDAPFVAPKPAVPWATGGLVNEFEYPRAERLGDLFRSHLDTSFGPGRSVVMLQPGDYVLPKDIAERLQREADATILSTTKFAHGPTNVTVHVDAKSVAKGSKIVQEMMEARERMLESATLRALTSPPGISLGEVYDPASR